MTYVTLNYLLNLVIPRSFHPHSPGNDYARHCVVLFFRPVGNELLPGHLSGCLLVWKRLDQRTGCRNSLLGGEYVWAKTCNLWITPHLDFQQHLACISRAGCNELIVTDFQLSALCCDDGVEMDCETWR